MAKSALYQIIVFQGQPHSETQPRYMAFRTNRPIRIEDHPHAKHIVFTAEGLTPESAEVSAIKTTYQEGIHVIEGLLELDPDTRRMLEISLASPQ